MSDFLFLMKNELSFVSRSVKNFLEEKEYSVDKCDISMKFLGEIKEPAPLVAVDAGLLLENTESRVYLYDLCIEKDSKLVIIGEVEQLREITDITSPAIVAAQFTRPVNAKNLTEKLVEIIEEIKIKGLRKRILVVDDSPTFLRTAMEWLENDYNVSICPSATAAFHMIETNRPDLILLDYEMPVCSGAQFLQMLQSENQTSGIPVIFLTSRSDPATVKEVLALGPKGYLLKTQPREKILQSINEFFEKSKAF